MATRAIRFRNLSASSVRAGAAVIITGTFDEPGETITLGAECSDEASARFLGIAESDVPRGSVGIAVRGNLELKRALVSDVNTNIGDMLQTTSSGTLQPGTLNRVALAFQKKVAGDGQTSIMVLML